MGPYVWVKQLWMPSQTEQKNHTCGFWHCLKRRRNRESFRLNKWLTHYFVQSALKKKNASNNTLASLLSAPGWLSQLAPIRCCSSISLWKSCHNKPAGFAEKDAGLIPKQPNSHTSVTRFFISVRFYCSHNRINWIQILQIMACFAGHTTTPQV